MDIYSIEVFADVEMLQRSDAGQLRTDALCCGRIESEIEKPAAGVLLSLIRLHGWNEGSQTWVIYEHRRIELAVEVWVGMLAEIVHRRAISVSDDGVDKLEFITGWDIAWRKVQ